MVVEVHDAHLPLEAPEEDWIDLVGREGWVAVTKDKNVRYRMSEIEAIRKHMARVIVIREQSGMSIDNTFLHPGIASLERATEAANDE